MQEKYNQFKELANGIENKYYSYFSSIPSVHETSLHASLFDYFFVKLDDKQPPELLFIPDRRLDDEIENELLQAYEQVYGSQPPNLIRLVKS